MAIRRSLHSLEPLQNGPSRPRNSDCCFCRILRLRGPIHEGRPSPRRGASWKRPPLEERLCWEGGGTEGRLLEAGVAHGRVRSMSINGEYHNSRALFIDKMRVYNIQWKWMLSTDMVKCSTLNFKLVIITTFPNIKVNIDASKRFIQFPNTRIITPKFSAYRTTFPNSYRLCLFASRVFGSSSSSEISAYIVFGCVLLQAAYIPCC